MILCPKCLEDDISVEMKETAGGLICSECEFKFKIQDDLVIFQPQESGVHNGMKASLSDGVIGIEDKHFWWKTRKKFINSVFNKYVKPEDEIMEVGAGTGNVAKYLIKNGYKNISISDVHLGGLKHSQGCGAKMRYQFDIIKTPFNEHFDVVGMFDVLEHTDNDRAIVKNIYRMLKPGGKAIITVPAHEWLWNKEDAVAGHRRRYEVEQLKKLFAGNGFKILEANAFFVSLLPLLYLRKLIHKDDGVIKDKDLKDRFKINSISNFILEKILNIESKLFSHISLRYGGSIILVGEK